MNTVSISISMSIAHYGILFSLWKCKAFKISRPLAYFFIYFVFPSNACGCSEMKFISKPGNICTMPTILCLSFGLVYEFLPQTCRVTHFCYCTNHQRCIWSFRKKKKIRNIFTKHTLTCGCRASISMENLIDKNALYALICKFAYDWNLHSYLSLDVFSHTHTYMHWLLSNIMWTDTHWNTAYSKHNHFIQQFNFKWKEEKYQIDSFY